MANTDIASAIVKSGGCNPSVNAVADTIAYASKNGGRLWDGNLPSGAGHPRSTTGTLDKATQRVVELRGVPQRLQALEFCVFRRRGQEKYSVLAC